MTYNCDRVGRFPFRHVSDVGIAGVPLRTGKRVTIAHGLCSGRQMGEGKLNKLLWPSLLTLTVCQPRRRVSVII